MKKSFLLAAALLVVGSSTMVAKTVSTMENPTLEFKKEVTSELYLLEVLALYTYEVLYFEEMCLTTEEALLDRGYELVELYGGFDVVTVGFSAIGDCEL